MQHFVGKCLLLQLNSYTCKQGWYGEIKGSAWSTGSERFEKETCYTNNSTFPTRMHPRPSNNTTQTQGMALALSQTTSTCLQCTLHLLPHLIHP